MTETDDPRRTVNANVSVSVATGEERLEDPPVSTFWIAGAPLFVLAAALAGWGFAELFAFPLPDAAPVLPDRWGGIDLVAAGLVLGLAPAGVREMLAERRRQELEEQFPDFLTDLAANRRAGFTLAESVRLAARADYGPLTPHVERMGAQLSWNMPFEETLRRFADRVDTPLVDRSVTLVLEAERSGGHIKDVLEAVARDARELKHLDRERQLSMKTYTIVMYVTFCTFLAVVGVLQSQLLPELVTAAGQFGGEIVGASTTTIEAHRTFFYTASIVQGLGTGTMAGMMSRGRVGPGLVHAATMVLASAVTFSVLLV